MTLIRSFATASLALMLAACADMGHIHPQSAILDPNALETGKTLSSDLPPAVWPTQQWWESLHDEQLNRLVATALADSPTLRVAQARVRQASAIAGVSESATKPAVTATASINRELYATHGTTAAVYAGSWQWRNEAALHGSYDLDLWGHNRDALAAALDDIHMASAEAQMSRLTLETAIVRSYIQLSVQYAVQDSVRSSLEQHKRILAITRKRQRAGLATEADVTLVETTLPVSERALEESAEAIALLRNQLAALTGKGPAAGESITRPTLKLDHAVALPAALPAELIGRRPDIAAQRWRVEAAAKRIKVAKTDFYPNINLLAYTGLQSIGFSRFLQADAATRGIAPAVSLPIFDGGRLRAQLGNQTALYDIAVEQYNATVIQALSDVANAITRVRSVEEQSRLTEQSLASAIKARSLAEQAYRAGMTDSINALNAQVALLSEEARRVQVTAQQLDGYVSLMAALGGGVDVDLPKEAQQAELGQQLQQDKTLAE
jgi:NodT family efflux transporter outer membrane factor (OMF) lipoprotein